MTSGSVQSVAHRRRPGRSVRTVSQAIGSASAIDAAVTAAARPSVRPRVAAVREEKAVSSAGPSEPATTITR